MENRPSTITFRRTLVLEALDVMEAEYARPDLSLDDVALRIATSRRQLQRSFIEQADTTFRTRLVEIRMKHGAELLRESPAPVNVIARRVGYTQPAQFAKAFRRVTGRTPSEYRRLARVGG